MSKLKLISVNDMQFPLSLLKAISDQRHNGLFCDVTIIVQDRKFRAHKTMLSASSTYFRQLFSVAGQVVELNFIKADIFEEILNYIYTSKIYRVRSDKLEDLISAGKILGVKFIANLAIPLSQVKGLSGLNEGDNGNVPATEKNETNMETMPIITETFSLSAEEFRMVSGSIDRDDPDTEDVLFVSELQAPQAQNVMQSQVTHSDVEESPEPKRHKGTTKEEPGPETGNAQYEKHKLPSECEMPKKFQDPQDNAIPAAAGMHSNSCDIIISDERSLIQNAPSTPVHLIPDAQTTTLPLDPIKVPGVQKKNVLLEQSPDQPSKITLSDVRTTFRTNDDAGPDAALTKTVTLEKAAEIDSLTSGCKVYANIGENTYDIVPVNEYSGDGPQASRAAVGQKSQTEVHGAVSQISGFPRGKKKGNVENNDHYELVMDGKTFFVCVVCKRPYVCRTSLKRHFNTHTWERKYPCRYCDKVFALSEYRTKHEINHTGERRYQCLLCNEMFINYQLLSSHCKQMHNQDPSGRKEKDDKDNNLYRLLPCKTVQFKPYSFVSSENGGIPIFNENGVVQPSSQNNRLIWDEVFNEPDAHNRPAAQTQPGSTPGHANQTNAENTTDFEFVIPETY